MNLTQPKGQKREMQASSEQEHTGLQPWDDLVAYLRNYVREEPETAACLCLGVGFILGWKLKPW